MFLMSEPTCGFSREYVNTANSRGLYILIPQISLHKQSSSGWRCYILFITFLSLMKEDLGLHISAWYDFLQTLVIVSGSHRYPL